MFLFPKFNYFLCRREGSPLVRTPSPRRRNHLHPQHDIGFSDTVSNVVEIVKEERGHRGYRHNGHGRYPRGMNFLFLYKRKMVFLRILQKSNSLIRNLLLFLSFYFVNF